MVGEGGGVGGAMRALRLVVVFTLAAATAEVRMRAWSSPPVERWRVAVSTRGTPVADDRAVFAVAKDRRVLALNKLTGAAFWQSPVGSADSTLPGTTLRLAPSLVIVGDSDVVALDRAMGRERWRVRGADGDAIGRYLGEVSGDVVLTGSATGAIYAISADTGRVLWRTMVAGGRATVFAPVLRGSQVLAAFTVFDVPRRAGLAILDASTGAVRSLLPLPADNGDAVGWGGGLAADDTHVLVSGDSGRVWQFDLRRAAPVWSIAGPADGNLYHEAIAIGASYFFVGSFDGSVAAYASADHRLAWRFQDPRLGSMGVGLLTVRGVVICPFAGALVALDERTGRELWRVTGAVPANPAVPFVAQHRMYVAGRDGLAAFSFDGDTV